MEYMYWCEDMGMEPVLAVWAGLTIGGGIVTGAELTPYVDDILDELEFLLGDAASTTYGALRAQYGQPAPFALRYVEVGNEDNLNDGCATYASRFADIYDAVHARYPDLTLIASTSSSGCLPAALPNGTLADTHHYLSPDDFVASFDEWDHVPRDGPGVLVGEYGSTTGNDGSTTYWSNMQGSCSEAVYMIGTYLMCPLSLLLEDRPTGQVTRYKSHANTAVGMERNSDIVKMASFAPLFEHYDMAQWSVSTYGPHLWTQNPKPSLLAFRSESIGS